MKTPITTSLNTPILPILEHHIPEIPWQINPEHSALENLQDLLSVLNQTASLIRSEALIEQNTTEFYERHIQCSWTFESVLSKLGHTPSSIRLLHDLIQDGQTRAHSQNLPDLTDSQLLLQYIALQNTQEAAQNESFTQGAPGNILEAEHALALTLIFIELHRRHLLPLVPLKPESTAA